MQQAFEDARKNMVDGQLLPNKITDPALIDALRRIPRENFVPEEMRGIAYVDEDIAIGGGRYLPEPLVLARLLQEASLKRTDVVLDIGSGTGYAAAIMGNLAGTVVGLESNAAMAAAAESMLRDLGVINAAVVHQPDLRQGYPQQGPYNVILINGSVPHVPENILQQLADGGRLLTVRSQTKIKGRGYMGTGIMITRRGAHFAMQSLFDAATPTLSGFESPEAFVF